jgi:hypothetical protein
MSILGGLASSVQSVGCDHQGKFSEDDSCRGDERGVGSYPDSDCQEGTFRVAESDLLGLECQNETRGDAEDADDAREDN